MSHLVSTSVVVAIIYLRVSTEEQGRKGFSIPEQRRECMAKAEELAKERGAKLQVYEFLDMVSADWLERPELDRVRAFMSVNHVDYFVCLDPDRFSRNLVNQLLVDGEIRRHGVEPVYVSGNYANTPEGQFFSPSAALLRSTTAPLSSGALPAASKARFVPAAFRTSFDRSDTGTSKVFVAIPRIYVRWKSMKKKPSGSGSCSSGPPRTA